MRREKKKWDFSLASPASTVFVWESNKYYIFVKWGAHFGLQLFHDDVDRRSLRRRRRLAIYIYFIIKQRGRVIYHRGGLNSVRRLTAAHGEL
jgi:hypothetical protein